MVRVRERATPSNPRICGVNPKSVGDATLTQGGGHRPVYYKSFIINPIYFGYRGRFIYNYI